MSSHYGKIFQISTWGESHGKGVGVVIDGCPAGLPLTEADIQPDLDRRRPGQSKLTTKRQEADQVEILSGVFDGKTTGTPISLMVKNKDQRSGDYKEMNTVFRPSHADYTYFAKYGIKDYRGGGRTSARETIGRVASGAIAKKLMKKYCGLEVLAYVSQVFNIHTDTDPLSVTPDSVESSIVRCPDTQTAKKMEQTILQAKEDGESLGGVIQLVIKNMPPGVGEPVFDRAEACLAHAMLSIPATKGFEIGSGFQGTTMRGSEHNDPFVFENGKFKTKTNHSGGIQGGITNGMPILCRIAFKPVATILKPQETVDINGKSQTLAVKGRHDPCVLPRAVVIVEAMAALTMTDLFLENKVCAEIS